MNEWLICLMDQTWAPCCITIGILSMWHSSSGCLLKFYVLVSREERSSSVWFIFTNPGQVWCFFFFFLVTFFFYYNFQSTCGGWSISHWELTLDDFLRLDNSIRCDATLTQHRQRSSFLGFQSKQSLGGWWLWRSLGGCLANQRLLDWKFGKETKEKLFKL